jgi:hypothetical protein
MTSGRNKTDEARHRYQAWKRPFLNRLTANAAAGCGQSVMHEEMADRCFPSPVGLFFCAMAKTKLPVTFILKKTRQSCNLHATKSADRRFRACWRIASWLMTPENVFRLNPDRFARLTAMNAAWLDADYPHEG